MHSPFAHFFSTHACIWVQVSDTKSRLYWFIQTELGGWIMMNVRSITGQSIADLLKSLRAHLAAK